MSHKKCRIILADVKSHNVQGKSNGHYIPLSNNYREIFKEEEFRVAGGPVYSKYIDYEHLFVLPFDSLKGQNPIRNKLNVLRNCLYLFSSTDNNDKIVLQHSGVSTAFLGIALFAKRKNKIFVIQYDTDSLSSPIKRFIYRFAKSKIRGIICPNDSIGSAFGLPYCVVTDYLYTEDKLKNDLDYCMRKYDYSIIGTLHKDKGVVEVAKCFVGKSYSLFIAGRASDADAKELTDIAASSPNITVHLGFVSDEDYQFYMQNSRYCILNYKGVYYSRSSGVVLDTIFNGVPVVGRNCPALSFVEKEGLGCLFTDVKQFDFGSMLNKSRHAEYISNLNKYILVQKEYIGKLKKFIKTN